MNNKRESVEPYRLRVRLCRTEGWRQESAWCVCSRYRKGRDRRYFGKQDCMKPAGHCADNGLHTKCIRNTLNGFIHGRAWSNLYLDDFLAGWVPVLLKVSSQLGKPTPSPGKDFRFIYLDTAIELFVKSFDPLWMPFQFYYSLISWQSPLANFV